MAWNPLRTSVLCRSPSLCLRRYLTGAVTTTDPSDLSENSLKGIIHAKTGQRIEVAHGNLLDEPTDAIVNPTDTYLRHEHGLSRDIMAAAGYWAWRQNLKLLLRFSSIRVGSVGLTNAGDLDMDCIIHAIGPTWDESVDEEEMSLRQRQLCSVMHHALVIGHERNLVSLSSPAISSGYRRFPKDICARLLLGSTLSFFSQYKTTTLETVRFVDIDLNTCRVFVQEALTMAHPNLESLEKVDHPTESTDDSSSV